MSWRFLGAQVWLWVALSWLSGSACSSATCPSGRVGGTGACVSGATASTRQNANEQADASVFAADGGGDAADTTADRDAG